jgi:hypothetical protein
MIVPYWSIDLFFMASFFVCRGRGELATLGRRIGLAILVAGACFVVMPLRLCFPRPEIDGVPGALFALLRSFDQTYNLCPSLHIALRTILVDTYARHSQGPWRAAVHVWFGLIGVSTVLTYQHQVVDVIGGFLLSALVFYACRERRELLPVVENQRVGVCYGTACLVSAAVGVVTWPWGGLLLWPALSLGIVTSAYFGAGPGVFRKQDGRLPLSARLVLGPCLLGQRLSLLYYRRQCRAWDQAAPGVWIGGQLSDREAAAAVRQGVTAVLDLTAEFSEARPFLATAYRNVPILDLTAPTAEQLAEGVSFIREHATCGLVYVHCKLGYSRSAAVVGAYLLASGQAAGAEEATAALRRARPTLVVRAEALEALRRFTSPPAAPPAAGGGAPGPRRNRGGHRREEGRGGSR